MDENPYKSPEAEPGHGRRPRDSSLPPRDWGLPLAATALLSIAFFSVFPDGFLGFAPPLVFGVLAYLYTNLGLWKGVLGGSLAGVCLAFWIIEGEVLGPTSQSLDAETVFFYLSLPAFLAHIGGGLQATVVGNWRIVLIVAAVDIVCWIAFLATLPW